MGVTLIEVPSLTHFSWNKVISSNKVCGDSGFDFSLPLTLVVTIDFSKGKSFIKG